MGDKKKQQVDRMMAYARLLEKQAGKAVRPYRADGYMNLLNRYGTEKDSHERYIFVPEVTVPDESLTMFYEGNGLFAKIIDAPAEEALKHGFTLSDVSDEEVESFYQEALDELDWEETAMTAIKWARLFGGSIAVMLINDGHGLEEPLDWKHIKSIDDIRVYDRSVIQPDYESMFHYDPRDPFRTRGSRLGMPEFYSVYSRYGNFTVHESRCLVFQNGILPENSTNSIYQFWGMPEYIRIHKAIQDAEISHRSAPRMLDRSVQPVYKMKDLAAELATEEGESKVLRRLQTIDMARGMMNSITIDSEGEDYDFRSFQFSGVADVIDSACNYLSALTNIPQTILFGRSPAGMNSTGESDLENWYNFVERIQKRMIKSNLRYLLSIVFQAGIASGEVDEVPKIKIEFNPLWSMSDTEKATLDQQKAATAQVRAQTAQIYVGMEAVDPSEVRRKLADSSEFDIETLLDEYEDEDDLMAAYTGMEASGTNPVSIFESGDFAQYAQGVDINAHATDPGTEGSAPANAPAATKLPQDMSAEEVEQAEEAAQKSAKRAENQDNAEGYNSTQGEGKPFSVGVLVVSEGKILTGTRHNDFGYGLICGPGGHGEKGESPEQAAFRETEEEFGISPKALIPIGTGPVEPDTGLTPYLFLCTDYEGEPDCVDLEMTNPTFRTLEEIHDLAASLFQPFADGLKVLEDCVCPFEEDGGPDSGNHNHEGVPGQVGGSAPNGGENNLGSKTSGEVTSELKKCGKGSKVTVSVYDRDMDETYNDTFELGDDGNWTSPNSGRSLSEEELAHVISDKDTKESSLDVKGSGERIEPEGFASRMESFVGGGYSVGDILEKDDIEFIKNNMSETDQPLYRIEESRFTASSAEVGQELQFNGELRSFTRNSKVTNSMLDENSDEYAYMEDPVVFKTVGATKQFDVSPYAGAYATSQEESFVGGKFEVVGKGTYTAPNGNEYPMITIRQKGNTDGSTNPNISEKSIDKSARTATITIEENSDEGNSNSGNHNHGGRPGKIGGSTPKPSANGENTPCLDFADKKKRKKHFRSHGHEYSGLNEEQYVQHAIDFLKQPCGGDIDGFLSKDGEIYRFNTKTGELAVGVPGGAIKTCFHLRYNRKKGAVDIAAANRVFQNKKATESKTGS